MHELRVPHGKDPSDLWTLRASESGLELERDGERYVILPEELGKRATLADGALVRGVLSVRLEGRGGRDAFHLEDASVTALLRGLGPHLAVRWLLGQHVRFFLAIAILFLLTSIPVPGDPASGAEPIPLDWMGIVLGLGLVVIAIAARYRPQAWLFVLDAGWLFVLAATGVADVVRGAASPWWLLLYAALASSAWTAVRLYRRLRAAGAPE